MIFFEIEQVEKEENIIYTQKELIDFGLNIASGKMSKDDIKNWLINHRK
ncbi:MAG: hypothetical protein IKZ86_06250 [Spirochaetaceae bacterium]|nr:hypothetical protein [Spirochaetaceae bacterium]